jgi:hypothetical protein
MRVATVFIAAAALFAAAGVRWIHAQSAQQPERLSAEDRLEIRELVEAYSRGVDAYTPGLEGGPETASRVFTTDGVFVYSERTISGEAELQKFFAENLKNHRSRWPHRHLLSNLMIEPTPDGARGSVYLFQIYVDDKSMPYISAFGVYDDTFVRTSSGWRIKRRVYRQDAPATANPQPR